MNFMNMLKMAMGKVSPQQLMSQIAGKSQNPMLNNLIDMANKGDNEGVENFARNLFKEQGRDFDKEFKEFMGKMK